MDIMIQFKELTEKAGSNYYPVVDCRWGYAAFVAYVFKIKHETLPDEWWVVEMNEEQKPIEIKRICNY